MPTTQSGSDQLVTAFVAIVPRSQTKYHTEPLQWPITDAAIAVAPAIKAVNQRSPFWLKRSKQSGHPSSKTDPDVVRTNSDAARFRIIAEERALARHGGDSGNLRAIRIPSVPLGSETSRERRPSLTEPHSRGTRRETRGRGRGYPGFWVCRTVKHATPSRGPCHVTRPNREEEPVAETKKYGFLFSGSALSIVLAATQIPEDPRNITRYVPAYPSSPIPHPSRLYPGFRAKPPNTSRT